MQRLGRVFDVDLSQCPHCGGQLRVIAQGSPSPISSLASSNTSRRDRAMRVTLAHRRCGSPADPTAPGTYPSAPARRRIRWLARTKALCEFDPAHCQPSTTRARRPTPTLPRDYRKSAPTRPPSPTSATSPHEQFGRLKFRFAQNSRRLRHQFGRGEFGMSGGIVEDAGLE